MFEKHFFEVFKFLDRAFVGALLVAVVWLAITLHYCGRLVDTTTLNVSVIGNTNTLVSVLGFVVFVRFGLFWRVSGNL